MKSFLFLFSILLISTLTIMAMAYLNDNVTKIGLIELNKFINDLNREESDIDYMGMISKFQLHMDFYKENINQQEFDQKDLRVSMVISSYSNSVKLYNQKNYNSFSKALLTIVNLLRSLLNKVPLSLKNSDETDINLMLAYYFERNNYYDKALDKFNEISRKSQLDPQKIPIITLHRAFCMALTDRMVQAKDLLKELIREYNNESVAFTATTLLQYIAFFEQEIHRTKKSSENDLVKSEKLYKLIAYNDAIAILDNILAEDSKQAEKIQYIKARCYEESGDKEEAMELYQTIIDDNSDSEYAKQSNTRLLVIGTMDRELKKAKEIAEENNTEIQDPEFDEIYEVTTQYEQAIKNTAENQYIEEQLQEFQNTLQSDSTPEFDITGSPIPEEAKSPSAPGEDTALPTETASLTSSPAPNATDPTSRTTEPVATITSKETIEPVGTDKSRPEYVPPPGFKAEISENSDGSYQVNISKENIIYKVEYYNKEHILEYYIEYLVDENGKITGVVKRDSQGNEIQ